MQLRMNDVRIDECPKFLHPNPTDITHAIKFPGVGGEDDYVMPLALHGVTSYFPTRKPTEVEWNSRLRARMISETTLQCQAVLNSIDSTLNDARFIKELKSNVRVGHRSQDSREDSRSDNAKRCQNIGQSDGK
eukprot:scaffold8553_cov56-Attheya_sp.AAC.1